MPETIFAKRSLSLREIDEQLMALIETLDACPTEEDRQACLQEIERYNQLAVSKVDGVASMILFGEDQAEIADKEVKRWQARKKFFSDIAQRLRESALRVMAPAERKRFDGKRYSFVVVRNPASVVTPDESAVPLRFKTLTFQMRGELWERLIKLVRDHDEAFGSELVATMKADWTIRKSEIADAIKRAGSGHPDFDNDWTLAGTNVDKVSEWLLLLYRQVSQKLIGEGAGSADSIEGQTLADLMTRIANWKQGGSYMTARALAFEMYYLKQGIELPPPENPVPGADLAIANVRLDIK